MASSNALQQNISTYIHIFVKTNTTTAQLHEEKSFLKVNIRSAAQETSVLATENKNIMFHIGRRLKRFTPYQQKMLGLCNKVEELLSLVAEANTDNTCCHITCINEHC
jgi:hypothetical protein